MNALKNWTPTYYQVGFFILVIGFLSTPSRAEQIHRFTIWINAFIPGNVSVGRKIPSGKGTMISIKYIDRLIGCFDTDQRGFSSQYSASVRVRAVVTATSKLGSERLYGICGLTKKRHCKSGKLIKTGKCNPNRSVNIVHKQKSKDHHVYTLDVHASNPLAFGSKLAPIRMKGNIREQWFKNGVVRFSLHARVSDFPAFEGYVKFNRQIKRLFAIQPKRGAGPVSLAKGLTRTISGAVSFSTK